MEKVNRLGRRSAGNTPLGKLIRSRRQDAGLSLTQLASELGVSRPYLSRLERGEYTNPSSKVLTQLIRRFDLNVDDVYALSGNMFPEDLPNYGPYLRAKHVGWPETAYRELEDFYSFVKDKYSLG